MQDGVPTPYIKIRFHIIYPINSHGITSLYLLLFASLTSNLNMMSMTTGNIQNKKVIAVKYIIYNMNQKSI